MVELGCQSAIFDVLLGKLFFHGRVATFTRRLQTVSRDGYFWLYLLCHGASVLWSSHAMVSFCDRHWYYTEYHFSFMERIGHKLPFDCRERGLN